MRAAGEDFERNGGDPAVAAMFEDGEISTTDYEEAFNKFVSCHSSAGMSIENATINPLDQLTYVYEVHYNALSEDEGFSQSMECFERYLSAVTNWYSETNPSKIAPVLRDEILSCVQEAGLDAPDDAQSIREIIGSNTSDTESYDIVSECVADPMAENYPEIFSYAVPF